MRRLSLLLVGCWSAVVQAQVTLVGDIVVVQDPTNAITSLVSLDNMSVFPSHQEQFCRAAYNAMRTVLPDEFDGVISFSAADGTITDLDNVFQGSPVRSEGSGFGRVTSPSASTYNGQKISQCVFMGTLAKTASFIPGLPGTEALPSNPDADWGPSLGIQVGKSLTGIEIMGHEYGHHWLMGVDFDLGKGAGKQNYIRAYNEGNNNEGGGSMGYANQHYSHLADSRSVMYGECITPIAGTSDFKVAGCERKYSQIDQYLMGLRPATDVAPMLVLEDPANPGKGVDSIALNRTASPTTVKGMIPHMISADDIIRAMGSRTPAYGVAQHCWRVAFVVVLPQGMTTIPPALLQKVERYRTRWLDWFPFATDGRGSMDTHVTGVSTCLDRSTDAGVVIDAGVDAGQVDAGTDVDAGADAGEVVEPDPDAGTTALPDGGTTVAPGTTKIRPGCGCADAQGTDLGGEFFAALVLFAALGLCRRA